jgi:hypothetical protein
LGKKVGNLHKAKPLLIGTWKKGRGALFGLIRNSLSLPVKKAGWERESWKGAWLLSRGCKYLLGGLPGFAAASACLCTSETTWPTEGRLQDRLLLLYSLGQVSTKVPIAVFSCFLLTHKIVRKE